MSTSQYSDDTPIWRYMDLARYISFIDRGIFFATAGNFADPLEASFGAKDAMDFRIAHKNLSREEIESEWKNRLDEKRQALSQIGVSCWHASDHESTALWGVYVQQGLGIAIKSTVGRLQNALKNSERSIIQIPITYSHYDDLEATDDPLTLLSFKRREFSYENEVRFALRFRDDEIAAIDSLSQGLKDLKSRKVATGIPRPIISVGKSYASNDPSIERRAAPTGIHLNTDLDTMIERVVLAQNVSYPTRRAVAAVTKAFGLNLNLIAESSIDQIPWDDLMFVDPIGKRDSPKPN